jgi:DNA-binding NarL/FixJ family response regulator
MPNVPNPALAGTEMSPRIRIVCVDDNDLVCGAMERKFSGNPAFEWCGALPDAHELVDRIVEIKPDVLLLDLCMPGPDPLEQVPKIIRAVPECRVIVLSGVVSPTLVERAFKAGARAYLSKADASAEIVDAVERTAAGERALGTEVRMVIRASAVESGR